MTIQCHGQLFESRWRLLCAGAAWLALLPSPQALASDLPKDIETITTTASRVGVDEQRQPLVVSVVDHKELELLSTTHIEEALKLIAGAQLQRGNGQEYLPALRSPVFTGAGACGGLLTAEDGIPLRAAGFCNINELFEAHSEMAQRIEVLKGPGSALYGSNAVHGVINVITPDTTQGDSMVGVDYGSYGYDRYKLRSGKDLGTSGIGVNASVTRDSGYREQEGVKQEKINVRHRFDHGSLRLMSGLTYTNLDQETAGYITGKDAYKDEGLAQANENPEAYRKARAFRLWTKASWQMGHGDLVSITPYVRDQSMDFLMHFLPGTPLEQNSQKGAGIQTLWRHQLSPTVTIKTGVDAEYTEGSLVQEQEGPTQGSPFLIETVPEGKHYDYDVDASLYAPFVSVDWQKDAWLFTVGGRYEHMNYAYTNNMNSGRLREDGTVCGMGGCRYSRPPSRNDSFNNLSPKLGMSYQFSASTLLYANLSHGFRAPQATELYRLQRGQTVADLKSEEADNIEFGVKANYAALHYTAAVYYMRKNNFIFRDSDYFYVNDGKSRHVGVELEVLWQFAEQWDLAIAATQASHTYRHEQILGDVNINGNDIDTAPATVADVRLGYQLSPAIRTEVEWNHVSRYYTDPENLHQYDGHDIVNLRASWDITPVLSVYGRINNLTDEAYAERADYTSFSGDRYFPGRPRNYMISLIYRWE